MSKSTRDKDVPKLSAHVKDLRGQRFEKLVVLDKHPTVDKGRAKWTVQCDCGAVKEVAGSELKRGKVRSCGCMAKQWNAEAHTTHGMSGGGDGGTPEYTAWMHMKSRCSNPEDMDYPDYGGRGISYDPAWEDFNAFLAAVGEKPEPKRKYSLERVDNEGHYAPGNVKWATWREQRRNQRSREKAKQAREAYFKKLG